MLGIGINVTTKLEDLPEVATSLAATLKAAPPKEAASFRKGGRLLTAKEDASFLKGGPVEVTKDACRRFAKHYRAWSSQGFAPIREALRPKMGLFGHPVHVSAGSDYFDGTAQDMDERGLLVVRLDSGVQRAFEVGEVTLLR